MLDLLDRYSNCLPACWPEPDCRLAVVVDMTVLEAMLEAWDSSCVCDLAESC